MSERGMSERVELPQGSGVEDPSAPAGGMHDNLLKKSHESLDWSALSGLSASGNFRPSAAPRPPKLFELPVTHPQQCDMAAGWSLTCRRVPRRPATDRIQSHRRLPARMSVPATCPALRAGHEALTGRDMSHGRATHTAWPASRCAILAGA